MDAVADAVSIERLIVSYTATGGGVVTISEPVNPWQVLGLRSTDAPLYVVKAAFKKKINQSARQNRAMISLANHILTSTTGSYARKESSDEFYVIKRDCFMLAACGHTQELASMIAKGGQNILQDGDEDGRTLLYIASRSGFYDTCKMLLEKGAPVNQVQRDGSTALHGAAFYNHALVVGLLLKHGARINVKNKWKNTPLGESATPEIRSLIQTALTYRMSCNPLMDAVSTLDPSSDGRSSVPDVVSIERLIVSYTATRGGVVAIFEPLNPWQVLDLHSTDVSLDVVKAAFRKKINQSARQNRAMISLANHILTSSSGSYERKESSDEFYVIKRDHFVLAACGHTQELASMIAKGGQNILQDGDEDGRTLLYIASRSGFYDTCKMLLEKGAPVNQVQRDDSTALHGAAFYNHALVVGLLLEHGARIDVKNKWGNTPLRESATPEIRSLIQTASTDRISSLAATLRAKQLVLKVRLIEHGGKVIAKELVRDRRALDEVTREKWNLIQASWELVWHGTRYNYLQSILESGLMPAGSSDIKPSKGHYGLGEVHFGIANWAAAIFVSPNILYAAHPCYSERVFSESEQWCVLVKAYCKPGSFKSYDPTVFGFDPMNDEPTTPEYRVSLTDVDKTVVLRVEAMRSVVVRSLMFVRLSFLEGADMNFDEAMKLLH